MDLATVLECDIEHQEKAIKTFLIDFTEKYEVFLGKDRIVAQ